jgi:hypothetical protein
MRIVATGQNGKKLVDANVNQFPFIIGRAAPAKVIVQEGDVSRQHLEINWDGRLLNVTDLKSRNGVYVGGKRIESGAFSLPCTLQLGSSIRIELTADPEAINAEVKPALFPKPPAPLAKIRQAKKLRGHLTDTDLLAKVFWEWANGIENHWIIVCALLLGALYGLFRLVVMRDDVYSAVVVAIGAPFGLLAAGIFSALIFALPGWLIRGSYDPKPMIIGFSLAGMAYLFAGNLTVFVFAPMAGHIVKVLIVAAIVFSSFSSWSSFLMTTFPSRWRGALLRIAVITSVLSTFGASKALVFITRQELLNKLFSLQNGDVVKSIGGALVSPGDLANDLRRFAPEDK